MEKVWRIMRWYGDSPATDAPEMPGHLSEQEVSVILQRLVCRNLSEDDIIKASLRKNDTGYSPFLERTGRSVPISIGDNPHYTAELIEIHT